jgi:hypothetical protein
MNTKRHSDDEIGPATFQFEMSSPAMNEQRVLLNKHPLFFRAVLNPRIYRSPLAHWGIECGPGWYEIIDEAATKIEIELQRLFASLQPQQHLQWLDRRLLNISETDSKLNDYSDDEYPLIPYCTQIKEKMGILRISLLNGLICDSATWTRIRAAVTEAERESETTCERCGMPGFLREFVWSHVYCDNCANGVY